MTVLLLMLACTAEESASTPTTEADPTSTPDSAIHTGETGAPSSDTASLDTAPPIDTGPTTLGLAGQTFAVDRDNVALISPFGILDLLYSQWGHRVLIEFLAETPTTVDVRFALAASLASPPVQDLCVPTLDAVGGDFTTSPLFTVSGLSFEVDIEGFRVPVEDAVVTGTVTSGAQSIDPLAIQAAFRTEGLVPLFEPAGGADAVCLLAASFGTSCVPCPSSSSSYCLPHEVETRAEPVSLSLVERTPADVAADPACP